MEKRKKILIVIMLFFVLTVLSAKIVFANNIEDIIQPVEYTEDFKKYLELSDEEKNNVTMPRMFDILNTKVPSKNPLYLAKMLKSSLASKYSLLDYIPNNLVIKNQQDTQTCWAFSALASLETNLALKNYYNGITSKVYDFSERHMEYATSRIFANNVVNPIGFNRKIDDGGNYFLSTTYLTNGTGAIDEKDMVFENNTDIIDISNIQNKTVTSQVYDTIDFESHSITTVTTEFKQQMKDAIKSYGAINAALHGPSITGSDYYNNDTGALYCDNTTLCPINHSVAIIGWDDSYSKNNFNTNHQPKSDGAWIAKNSWGSKLEYDLIEIKKQIFEQNKSDCIQNGWTDATMIPDSVVISNGFTIVGDKAFMPVGNNGFTYISYEDVNIYSQLCVIMNASDSVDYEYIYQYNYMGVNTSVTLDSSKAYLANVFTKQSTGKEYLTQVSIYAPETYTCKVYVNPNGTSKKSSDLQQVSLKAGDSETFGAGYHSLEFSKPVKINSDNFVVVVEIQGTRNNELDILGEANIKNSFYDFVELESGKCFLTFDGDFENNRWADFSQLTQLNSNYINCDSSIKAFTVSKIEDHSLNNIEIKTPPSKTSYIEGDNFDKTGMVVVANYNDETSETITDYNISNGTNLIFGQTNVTITYEDKSITQPITVEKNSVTGITIKTPPSKIEYKAGNNFDKTGMVVEATYKNGTTSIITDYTIQDGINLKNGQSTITIYYDGMTVQQSIIVQTNLVQKIEIQKVPNKTTYVEGQNFDKTGMVILATYEDGQTIEISDYIVEDGSNLSSEQTFVTISFEGKTVTQAITVEKKSIASISIKQLPSKVKYIQNKESLDLTGGSIQVTYNDNSTEIIPMSSELITVSGFSNKVIGKVTITLSYQSKTLNFDVEIIQEIIPDQNPESSNFDNAKCIVKKVKKYTSTDGQEYVLIEVEINEIDRSLKNDSYEYYYYLSSNKDEKNIKNWVKVKESQSASSKLEFTINTNDISNYEELSNANVLYLYIKEVTVKGGNQKVTLSSSMVFEAEDVTDIFLNGSKQESVTSNNSVPNNTFAPGPLPKAGLNVVFIVSIFVVALLGVVVYVRYRTIDK